MEKLWLIIRREYLTRVTKRSFIIATLITPFAFALFFVIVGVIFSYESDDQKKVAVIDEGNILKGAIKDERNLYFQFVDQPLDTLRTHFDETDFDGILVIPDVKNILDTKHTIYYYSGQQPSIDIETVMRQRVSESLRDYKIDALQLERKQLEALNTRVDLEPEPIEESGEDATRFTGYIAAGIGGLMGFIMYITVFVYGMMVMRSVMEEKTTRIVEVMISSVKPFPLMLGKIIGVGAVGLTQFLVWVILIPTLVLLAQLIFGIETNPNPQMGMTNEAVAQVDTDDAQAMAALALQEINGLNWWTILPLFLFFFLGGYFLYASLFAAVGSAISDDTGEGQSLTIPITIPVILALYIMMVAVQAPNSSLAKWSSIFPLFSPIVMPARLAFEPPAWEIVVSVLVLALSALFFTWLSGRIYRVGILLYGKKVGLRTLAKWLFSSQ